ncbi:MAG: hypothetical protein ABJB01_10230 [Rudaea sp.]
MRWLMLLFSIAGFSFAYVARTPEMLGLSLLVGFIGLVGAFLGFAAARVAATARPDAALLTDADISALRASMRTKKAPLPRPSVPPAPDKSAR